MFVFFQSKQRHNGKECMDERYISEMKQFFIYYHGDSMSMYRDDPEKYEKYRAIPNDFIEKWRQELIVNDFDSLSNNEPKDKWITVDRLLRLISSSDTLQDRNFKILLTQLMVIAPVLDKCQRILILEHFAGRTSHQRDGGIYLIHTKTSLTELMVKVVDILADFSLDASDNINKIGWEDIEKRYTEVQNSIQNAYRKFGIA